MKKYFLLVIFVVLFIASGCNRFEHEFYAPPTAHINASINVGYSPLQVTFTDGSESGSEPIVEWTWDFDGDGIPEHVFNAANNPDSVVYTYNDPALYNVVLTIDDGKTISVDTTSIEVLDLSSPFADFNYSQPDYDQTLINFVNASTPGTNPITTWAWDFDNDDVIDSNEQNPSYTFADYGDYEVTLSVSDGSFENTLTKTISVLGRSVIVELFTGQWCSNCPNSEEALHNIKEELGSRFSYVEYHWGDDLEPPTCPVSYYPFNGTLPLGIVNGNELLFYESPSINEVQTWVEDAIEPLLQELPLITLSDLQVNLTGSVLNGSVNIDIDPSVNMDNLKLVAVIIEDFNNEYLNNHGEPHYNIALNRLVVDLTVQGLINFSINDLDALPAWYQNIIPDDLTLVLWVQRLDALYDETTCAVYNVIEVPLQR
jgi:PKD repeat protein